MEFGAKCVECIFSKELLKIQDYEEARKEEYIRLVRGIVEGDYGTAPEYQFEVDKLHNEYWGHPSDIYTAAKREHTRLMLQEEAGFDAMVAESTTPLATAIKIAAAGNYIDMGAMNQVEIPYLLSQMQAYIGHELDATTYATFYEDLIKAQELVYLTDNCGEVVLDKILIQAIRKEFPHISICAIVKGSAVLNDVTREDAELAGLTDLVEVIDNGTAIAGTSLPRISEEAKKRLNEADVIISKGQGNFETLSGCGLNIYYLLLCKCEYFATKLGKERMEMAFINEAEL